MTFEVKEPPFVCRGQLPRVEFRGYIPRSNRAVESVSLYFLPLLHALPMSQTTKIYRKNPEMESLLKDSPPIISPKPGDVLDGKILFKGKNKLIVDIGGVASGIISGRELRDSFNTYQTLIVGSDVSAMVLEEENEEGMIVMSLRRVSQQKAWDRINDLIAEDGTMTFVPQEANKGGLLANIDGIRTFLPVSQLAPINYPR